MNLLLQAFIAYMGLLPPLYALVDLYFIGDIKPNLLLDFIIYYTLIIFTFVGAVNWKISNDGKVVMTLYGALPSLLSFLIILALLTDINYLVISNFLIICLTLQLLFDYLIFLRGIRPAFYVYYIRIPVTFFLSMIIHLPIYII
tara:strand:+ start:84 stop:515 length:432 start_codon:yes stop_codon:yes gene_type:complete